MSEYHIDRSIDGHPICFNNVPLSKKEALSELNDLSSYQAKSFQSTKYLEAENTKLREALEYYANDSLWSKDGEYDAWCYDGDGSKTAQQALIK